MLDKWLVLGGCPRSGTTSLNFVLNSHSKIFLSNEQNLYRTAEIVNSAFYREDHIRGRKPRELSTREIQIGSYDGEVASSTIRRDPSLKAALSAIYRESLLDDLSGHQQVIIGDKYPMYYRWDIEWLEKILGNIKYIHVSRSPLDVISSSLHRTKMSIQGKDWWPIRTVEYYLEEWVVSWNFIVANSKRENFLHVRYEDFTLRPQAVVEEISSFLGVECEFELDNVYHTKGGGHDLAKGTIEVIKKQLPDSMIEWSDDLKTLEHQVGKLDLKPQGITMEMLYFLYLRQKRKFLGSLG